MSFLSTTQFFCDPLLEHHHHLPFSPFFRAPLRSHHLLLPPFPLEEPLALSLLHYFHPVPPFFPDAIEFSRTDFSSSVRRFTVEYNLSSPLPSHVSSSFPCSYGIETEPLLRLLLKGKKGDASYGQKLESEGQTGSESKRRWEAEIRGLDGQGSKISAMYKVETSSGKKDEPKKENPRPVRIVEIEEPERNPVNQGWGSMIREARRTMIMELEAMLDAVNPQPTGKMSPFRRKIDLPGQSGNAELKEIARGVAEVVHFLDQDRIKEELQEVSL